MRGDLADGPGGIVASQGVGGAEERGRAAVQGECWQRPVRLEAVEVVREGAGRAHPARPGRRVEDGALVEERGHRLLDQTREAPESRDGAQRRGEDDG